MLLLSDKLVNVPVMSLQTGTELARTSETIVDPRTLTIVALYVEGPQIDIVPSVLHVADIREAGELGFIVNDSNVLMSTEGLVRLQLIIDFDFTLAGTAVYDDHGKHLGKVADYAFDPASYTIQQIYTHQSFFKSLSVVSNIIHRRQIISVTKERIIVESATIKDRIAENAEAARAFVNPFRGTQAEPTDLH
ncbi:hypothetical protein H7Y40_00895 [Pedobacter sp.]|nr:hypothetical protein [Candidatus Saccharibacteria bacterium]